MFSRAGAGGVLLLAGLTFILLPISSGAAGFLENRGQVDEAVLFYGPAAGATVYFTSDALVLDFREAPPALDPHNLGCPDNRTVSGCAVWIRFEGSAGVVPAARVRLPGEANFLRGNDESKWRTGVPAFAEVKYSNVWPGVDLVYRMSGSGLESEAVLRPGANPGRIVFSYEGADRVVEQASGAFLAETPFGSFVHAWPGDQIAGAISHPEIHSGPTAVLPGTMPWCTYLGGPEHDGAIGIVLDVLDNPVVVGGTYSPAFPTTPGAYQQGLAGSADVFVTKLDPAGESLLWSTFLGGEDYDVGTVVALDPAGNPVVAGPTSSADFPVTAGAYDSTKAGQPGFDDVFVAKLSPTGDSLIWSTYLGGAKDEQLNGLVLDDLENVVLTGGSQSGNFPTTEGAFQTEKNPFVEDAFVTKLAAAGNALVWSTFLGGSGNDYAFHAELDTLQNVVVVGNASMFSNDFPTTPGAFDETYNGGTDVFAVKLDFTGSTMLWGTYLGSASEDFTGIMDLDTAGNVVLAGWTSSTDFPTTEGAFDETYNGNVDVFVTKLAAAGDMLIWSTFLGGTELDRWAGAILDNEEHPIVGYQTESTDLPFPPGSGGFDETYNGGKDAALARLSPDGTELLWNTYCGGAEYDYIQGNGLAIAADGLTAVMAGVSHSSDFPTSAGAYDETYNGAEDAIVFCMIPSGAVSVPPPGAAAGLWLHAARPNPFCGATTIRYELPRAADVTLSIHDAAGRLVRRLDSGPKRAGPHRTAWDALDAEGSPVAAGVYWYRLKAGDHQEARSVLLLK